MKKDHMAGDDFKSTPQAPTPLTPEQIATSIEILQDAIIGMQSAVIALQNDVYRLRFSLE